MEEIKELITEEQVKIEELKNWVRESVKTMPAGACI